jgi:hypothetical protein
MRRAEIFQLFLQGRTEEILSLKRSAVQAAHSQDIFIASLVLRGRLDEALAAASVSEDQDPSGLIQFFLGLGTARAGNFAAAEQLLTKLKQLRQDDDSLIGFFIYQLEGFTAYLQGQVPIDLSRQALLEAERSSHVLEPLARVLALDLLGHASIRAGEVRVGLRTLKRAKQAAEVIYHRSFPAAIAISILKYESSFGLEPADVESRLIRALIELDPKDSYSRSELRLEISRQAILRGKLRTARRILDAACPEILGSKNWLQTAWLHLRLAWIAKLEDRPLEALLSLQSAEVALNETSEPELRKKILSFRLSVLKETRGQSRGGRSEKIEDLSRRISLTEGLLRETQAFSPNKYGIEKRLQARQVAQFDFELIREDEDPFGDMMDRIARTERPSTASAQELLRHGYLGLLVSYLGLRFSRNMIFLGLPESITLVIEDGEAKVIKKSLGGLLGRFLLHLAEGPSSRAQVIETVWGYSYDSQRHDRLLAVAATRLRKLLGSQSSWLTIDGDRVTLNPEIVVRKWADILPVETRLAINSQARSQTGRAIFNNLFENDQSHPDIGLNRAEIRRLRIRQLQVLEDLATRGEVGVQDLVDRFDISRASALRDLRELVSLGFLIRSGATRATRYILRGKVRKFAGDGLIETSREAFVSSSI